MASQQARDQVSKVAEKYNVFACENKASVWKEGNRRVYGMSKEKRLKENDGILTPGKVVAIRRVSEISDNNVQTVNETRMESSSDTSRSSEECEYDMKGINCVDKNMKKEGSNSKEIVCGCCEVQLHLRYAAVFSRENIDMFQLRHLAWNGIPNCCRELAWKVLSGYLPATWVDQDEILNEKRKEYQAYINTYFEYRNSGSNSQTFKQICLDIPRTYPLLAIFQNLVIQKMYERILYAWAIRHPASSYVQGINDLISPCLLTCVWKYFGNNYITCDPSLLSPTTLDEIEADVFWLLTKLLDGIQNNYTPDQPGIQIKMHKLHRLIRYSDVELDKLFSTLAIEYSLFSFRWFNNLFVRDLPLKCVIRVWDTLWAEPDGFEEFSVYVGAALLNIFSKDILKIQEFHTVLMFFQELPTSNWNEENASILLAKAFQLQALYSDYLKR